MTAGQQRACAGWACQEYGASQRRACRALGREVRLTAEGLPLVQQLLGGESTPSQKLERWEVAQRIHAALDELSEADQEILLLRNFEGLSYEEIALLLGIAPAAARKRQGRALLRLHGRLFGAGPAEAQP